MYITLSIWVACHILGVPLWYYLNRRSSSETHLWWRTNQSFWVGPLEDGRKDGAEVAGAIRLCIIDQLGKDFKARWHSGVTAKYYSTQEIKQAIDLNNDNHACVVMTFNNPKAFRIAKKWCMPIRENGEPRTELNSIKQKLLSMYKEYFLQRPADDKLGMELLAGSFLKLAP
jgi:hypothetical protein